LGTVADEVLQSSKSAPAASRSWWRDFETPDRSSRGYSIRAVVGLVSEDTVDRVIGNAAAVHIGNADRRVR